MSVMRCLKRPTAQGFQLYLGPISEEHVDDFVKKVKANSKSGGDCVSYKLFKYYKKNLITLHHLVRGLSAEIEVVEKWFKQSINRRRRMPKYWTIHPISIVNLMSKISAITSYIYNCGLNTKLEISEQS